MKSPEHSETDQRLAAQARFECVGYRVRRLSRMVSGIYDEAFRSLDLKISQFTILTVLHRQGPLSASDLSRILIMDKSTASRNLERMRRRGWIAAVSGDTRGRPKIAVTREGSQLLRRAYPLWRAAQDSALQRLQPDGLKALDVVMDRMAK